MTVEKIKYFIVFFCPDEKGFFELPEGSIAVQIEENGGSARVKALVPLKEAPTASLS